LTEKKYMSTALPVLMKYIRPEAYTNYFLSSDNFVEDKGMDTPKSLNWEIILLMAPKHLPNLCDYATCTGPGGSMS